MNSPSGSRPAARYGSARRGRSPRWRAVAFAVVAIVVSAAIAFIAYRTIGSAPISANRVAFTTLPDNTMQLTIDVRRDDPSRPAVCIVTTRDISGAESARREVFVPPSGGETRIRTVITSGTEPVTADVFGCSYSVPAYLSRPGRPTE